MNKILKLSMVILCAFGIAACSAAKDPTEAYQGESPQTILKYGESSLEDKSFGEAIKRFEALDIQYPFAPETEKAQLYLVYAYYMKEDYPMSVAAADRFIRIHSMNKHVDYAYFMRGLASYYQNLGFLERAFKLDLAKRDLAPLKMSYHAFDELIKRYPHSRYAPAAAQFMVYLRNTIADHELQVGQYYYQRKAYVAAANRANNVVVHYQGAPAVMDSLKLLANSYKELGMHDKEQEALKVLDFNKAANKA